MKLKSVEVWDFKSIKHELFEINSNQICLVGKNESGKSSLLYAISFLNILEKKLDTRLLNKSSVSYPSGLPVIVGKFELSENDYKNLLELVGKFLDEEKFSKFPKQIDSAFIQIKRWGNGFLNISLSLYIPDKFGVELSKEINDLAKFYDIFLQTIYPEIRFYENEDLLIEPCTVDELLGDNVKYETFRKLLVLGGCKNFNDLQSDDINFVTTYLSDVEIELNHIFKKHYKQDQSINLKIVSTRGDKYNLVIMDNSKKSFSIQERSPGFQYYFSFLVNKLYSKKINGSRNTIVLLDEPGGSLHPKGSKDLLKSFDEISESSQIIYTTHNPFLTVRNNLDSLIYINKTASEGTKINKKPYLNKYQIIRKELGILLNDSFILGDINLIVEGNTEKLALHRIFKNEKYSDLEWINIYNADGVTNIPQALNYLGKNNLKLSGIVLLDSDKEAEVVKLKKAYKSNIEDTNWEQIEINSVYSGKKERTFEDLFPQQDYIGAFNKYCHSLKLLEIFKNPYIDYISEIEIETPIINTLDIHFKSFLPEGSKSTISKQDVIRILLDEADELREDEKKRILVNLFKLADKIQVLFKNIEKNGTN